MTMPFVTSLGLALLVVALLATLIHQPRPRLVWNLTESSPVGLYRVGHAGRLQVGTMVVAWPPGAARRLGAQRRYLPSNVPLVKRVAAAAGDRVCALGNRLLVNDRLVVRRRASDRHGRPMPWWRGCRTLLEGDLLLLMTATPDSFDGRYFGVTRRAQVIGSARLIWAG